MKNISVLINVVLLIAVGILYYLHFSGNKPITAKNALKSSLIRKDTGSQSALLAYVDLDSLNEKIDFIRNKRKELEAEQRSIENEWESGYRGLENQKNTFLKKGNAITQQEAEEFQYKLAQQQQIIDEKKQTLSRALNEKSYKFMDGIQKKLREFLEEYNKDKGFQYIFTVGTGLDYIVYKDSSLNITEDVIVGMNEKMKDDKK